MALLYPEDIDQRLSWPLGRAERLARQRRLPYVLLPDGSIRFRWEEIERLILPVASSNGPVSAEIKPEEEALARAADSIAKAIADQHEAEYQAICRAGRQIAAELQAQQEGTP